MVTTIFKKQLYIILLVYSVIFTLWYYNPLIFFTILTDTEYFNYL